MISSLTSCGAGTGKTTGRRWLPGWTRYGRELLAVPAIRKDGTRISPEFSIILVHGAKEELLGPAAIIRDGTARWLKEKELKERLASLEAPPKAPNKRRR